MRDKIRDQYRPRRQIKIISGCRVMHRSSWPSKARWAIGACAGLLIAGGPSAYASDHLDSPASVANPQADIGDVYAWVSSNGLQLNLVMTVQGHSFSDKLDYAIHIDSGTTFGRTGESVSVVCRFPSADEAHCSAGDIDSAVGNPNNPIGLEGMNHKFRVFAALRDDPFYNNIKGLVAAYTVAGSAIKAGARVDSAGCAHFDQATTAAIADQMHHTDGGAAQNFLYKWSVSAIVISIDLSSVDKGGKLLAVWGSTSLGGRRLDRMGRPFVGNTLLGSAPFSTDDESGVERQKYNEIDPSMGQQFAAAIARGLAFQDSLDGDCGNQLLAEPSESPSRYQSLTTVFADDRLWVNSASKVCTQFFAVELANVAHQGSGADCGGRAPTYDAPNVWRSLLIAGKRSGINGGLHRDEHPPSAVKFPFLAPPRPSGCESLKARNRVSVHTTAIIGPAWHRPTMVGGVARGRVAVVSACPSSHGYRTARRI